MQEREFDIFIQNQLAGIPNHIETLDQLTSEQYKHYQINKRAIARLKYKARVTETVLDEALKNLSD